VKDGGRAEAAQAGPLAQAQASQGVIAEQTALAQRQAELAGRRLEAEVRRPADAEAYRQRALAEAHRDQTKFEADADAYRRTTLATAEAEAARAQAAAYAERAVAQAQAEANAVRAQSLKGGNQELIAAARIVESLPAMVEAAALGLHDAHVTVLNGSEGVNQVLSSLVGQGLAVLDTVRASTAKASHNGTGGGASSPVPTELPGATPALAGNTGAAPGTGA
jgi:hypothetical protein